jgi:hypothetical protein
LAFGIKLIGANEVHGQGDLDALGGRLGEEFLGDLRALGVVQAVTDLPFLEFLLEGEGHAAADDELVGFLEEVVDEGDLVRDLGAAEDGQQRALRVSSTAAKALSSASMRKPAAFSFRLTPTIELCARCAVPNASLT